MFSRLITLSKSIKSELSDVPWYAKLLIVLIALGLFFGFVALDAAIIFWLWNALMPVLFTGVSAIGYWQAFGAMILVRTILPSRSSTPKTNITFNND